MRSLFTTTDLEINLSRMDDGDIVMTISSDYGEQYHKQQLFIGKKKEESIANDIERFWKSIKTKKLWRVIVNFFEIDWYDSDVDVYEYPHFLIKRGLKKTRTEYDRTGTIPKDWGVQLSARFHDTTAITPLLEVMKGVLESWWTEKIEKEFRKAVKPLLQKKSKYASLSIDEDDLPKQRMHNPWLVNRYY